MPLKTPRKYHYVYKVSFDKRFYIGVRSCDCPPKEDTQYIGSGNFILYKPKYHPPVKVILSIFLCRSDAEREEAWLLQEHIGKGFCMNRWKSGSKKYGPRPNVQQTVHQNS